MAINAESVNKLSKTTNTLKKLKELEEVKEKKEEVEGQEKSFKTAKFLIVLSLRTRSQARTWLPWIPHLNSTEAVWDHL